MAHEVKFGQLIGPYDEMKRDAVHVPVAPAIAACELQPGQHVGFVNDETLEVGNAIVTVGIVDPFLKAAIPKGQRFWLLLHPGSAMSLRHEWDNVEFDKRSQLAESPDDEWDGCKGCW